MSGDRMAFHLSTGLLVVLAAAVAPPTSFGQDGPVHQAHADMFRVAPPDRIDLFDPRMTVEQLRYTPLDGRVIIQGDIDFGTREDVARESLLMALLYARRLSADAEVVDKLDPTLRQELAQLAGLTPAGLSGMNADQAFSQLDDFWEVFRELGEGQAPKQLAEEAAVIRAGVGRAFRWPDGVIPYVIDKDCPNRKLILEAIHHWHQRTNRIRLVPLEDGNKEQFRNWVRFILADGCYSRVGKKPTPGEQVIGLAPGCLRPQIIHEIGHAVGLFHEQSRNDRDQHLIIHLDKTLGDARSNFDKIGEAGGDVGPFDFDSIMLYPSRAFAVGDGPVMERRGDPENEDWGIASGQAGGGTTELSDGDVRGVESAYPDPAKVGSFRAGSGLLQIAGQ